LLTRPAGYNAVEVFEMTTTAPNPDEVADLRRRLDELEARVASLAQLLKRDPPAAAKRWWRSQVGAFANDPVYEEIARLGREWRDSQRPHDAQDPQQDAGG
jgi:hypothetical protein